MNLTKRTPSTQNPLFRGFFDDFFNRDLSNFHPDFESGTMPAINIKDEADEYSIEVAAPGMKKDDFNIELDDNMLVISAEIKAENEEKKDNYTRKEFHYSSFKRSFNLPKGKVDIDKIDAQYQDGILFISLPKTPEAKPISKTISIK